MIFKKGNYLKAAILAQRCVIKNFLILKLFFRLSLRDLKREILIKKQVLQQKLKEISIFPLKWLAPKDLYCHYPERLNVDPVKVDDIFGSSTLLIRNRTAPPPLNRAEFLCRPSELNCHALSFPPSLWNPCVDFVDLPTPDNTVSIRFVVCVCRRRRRQRSPPLRKQDLCKCMCFVVRSVCSNECVVFGLSHGSTVSVIYLFVWLFSPFAGEKSYCLFIQV